MKEVEIDWYQIASKVEDEFEKERGTGKAAKNVVRRVSQEAQEVRRGSQDLEDAEADQEKSRRSRK